MKCQKFLRLGVGFFHLLKHVGTQAGKLRIGGRRGALRAYFARARDSPISIPQEPMLPHAGRSIETGALSLKNAKHSVEFMDSPGLSQELGPRLRDMGVAAR